MVSVFAANSNYWYSVAEKFIIPYEKQCCALMQRVILRDDCVFIIGDSSACKDEAHVKGVLSYNMGKTVFHCLPDKSPEVFDALKEFFGTRRIFCITGERDGTEFIQRVIQELGVDKQSEVREYRFLEYHKNKTAQGAVDIEKIVRCSKEDIDELMPLQSEYITIEVLPATRKINLAAERLSFEHTVSEQYVFATKIDNEIVAKAQTNALGVNYAQIGGVYTKEAFRRRGIASRLVAHIANYILEIGKRPILFVKEKNLTAYHAYQRAGFEESAKYRIVYYKE